MRILVLTSEDDAHVDAFVRHVSFTRPGWEVVRLHPSNIAGNLDFCCEWSEDGTPAIKLRIRDSGRELSTVDVIWWRKPRKPDAHPAATHNENVAKCSADEWWEWINSLVGIFPNAVWVNDYFSMRKWSPKINQIPLAKLLGFHIPPTLVTSKVSDVKRFLSVNGESIAKTMAYSGFVSGEEAFACYTNTLGQDLVEKIVDLDLELAPVFVQKRIEKYREYRVTVVGPEVFACLIVPTSAANPESMVDWRVDDHELLQHTIVQLPETVVERLTSMLKLMGLNYGAFDLIEDGKGEFYFLEVNPNGQYYWIELMTGAPMTEAVCRLMALLHEKHGDVVS